MTVILKVTNIHQALVMYLAQNYLRVLDKLIYKNIENIAWHIISAQLMYIASAILMQLSQKHFEVNIMITPILQMGKPEHS